MHAEEAARILVAHLFQRTGRSTMSESEMSNAASLDLDWFPPKEARGVVAGLVRAGFLTRTPDGELQPAFDARSTRVPLDFRPPKGLLSSLPPPGQIQETRDVGTEPPQPAQSRSAEPVAKGPTQPPAPSDALDLGALLQTFAEQSGEEIGVWVERMERVVQRVGDGLAPEVALLVAAAQQGFDVTPLAKRSRERLETAASS